MIGVPDTDRDRVVHAADVLVTVSDPEVSGEQAPVEALGAALWSLTDGQRQALLADLDGVMPGAVEEFVRWATPVMTFRRTDTRDTEIDGQAIGEREKVVLFYHSGNRDETAFGDPWSFDVTRASGWSAPSRRPAPEEAA